MVELPRACLNAGEIGRSADFFSFGTNDLTQTTFGLSRDDAGRFLGEYTDRGIIQHDPFVTLDPAVGELMEIAVERGRKVIPASKSASAASMAAIPRPIRFCEGLRLDYVSCSPYRVPVARLAAAQAALKATVRPVNQFRKGIVTFDRPQFAPKLSFTIKDNKTGFRANRWGTDKAKSLFFHHFGWFRMGTKPSRCAHQVAPGRRALG